MSVAEVNAEQFLEGTNRADMLETNFADSYYATLASTVILCVEREKQLM